MKKLDAHWIEKTLRAKFEPAVQGSFERVSIDSREVDADTLFIGVQTPTGHRQAYTNTAAQGGAKAAIVQTRQETNIAQLVVPDTTAALQQLALARRREFKGTVIGLTGSSGKTSTKELLSHLLGPQAYKTAGNLNNHLGVPLTILQAPMDSSAWALEAGISMPGDMGPLAETIEPSAALLTMIGSAHLENLKTREGIATEKGKLLHTVPADGHVVLHASDVKYETLQNLHAQVAVLAGKDEPLPKLPENYERVEIGFNEEKDSWRMQVGQEAYTLPLWTPGMARNAALCVTLARQLGVPMENIQERLHSWTGVELRGQWLRMNGAPITQRIYLDAYNSNPEALNDSLWRFERLSNKKSPRLYIIGTMAELGEESDALHREAIRNIEATKQDKIIFVGAKADVMLKAWQTLHPKVNTQKLDNPESAKNIEKIKMELAAWAGDCFIKGSHSTHLHTLAALCSPI